MNLQLPTKNAGDHSGLILVERFAFGIGLWVAGGADVMELQVGVGGHHDHASLRAEARKRE